MEKPCLHTEELEYNRSLIAESAICHPTDGVKVKSSNSDFTYAWVDGTWKNTSLPGVTEGGGMSCDQFEYWVLTRLAESSCICVYRGGMEEKKERLLVPWSTSHAERILSIQTPEEITQRDLSIASHLLRRWKAQGNENSSLCCQLQRFVDNRSTPQKQGKKRSRPCTPETPRRGSSLVSKALQIAKRPKRQRSLAMISARTPFYVRTFEYMKPRSAGCTTTPEVREE